MWCRASTAWRTIPDQTYSGRYGAIIGRFANRIKDNTFTLDRVTYHISRDAYVLKEADNKPYDERVWMRQPRTAPSRS